MINSVLIISSNFTGHGHKSIAESLCEKFSNNENAKVHIVDGFSLGGTILLNIAKAYGPITRKSEGLWELIWDISSVKPYLINEIIELMVKDRFLKLLKKVNPDLILSIHPNFNGSLMNILKRYNVKIPFVTLIADLVSISPLWADSRADYIISPTQEAKYRCMEFGVPAEKIKILGFPIRSRFHNYTCQREESQNYNMNKPLNCMIMSGGEGVGNVKKIAEILLDDFNCTVKIVAGRNAELKKRLEKSLIKKYGNKVEIHGFTKNIQDLMWCSDILFTRGSPNVIMEAIACNIPLIITDALPGQEEENPRFVEKYNLGIICKDTRKIETVISDLLANNLQKLNEIKNSQRIYTNSDAAKDIVNFILNMKNNFNQVAIKNANSLIPKVKI